MGVFAILLLGGHCTDLLGINILFLKEVDSLLMVFDKLFNISKIAVYSIIAMYTFFQFFLSQHNTVNDLINSNLFTYIIAAAVLEALHNLYDFVAGHLER